MMFGYATNRPQVSSIDEESPIAARVCVVDDDVSVRESLELLIRTAGWEPELFASAEEFLSQPRDVGPCCLVLDLTLPGLSGLDLQQRLTGRLDMPVIVISGYASVSTAVQAMKGGAVEVLTKPLDDALLLRAIATALDRSMAALREESERQKLGSRYASLTRRERQVMNLVVDGLLNKQAGAELGISEITVKAHRGQVMRKMGAESLAHLVMMAARLRA